MEAALMSEDLHDHGSLGEEAARLAEAVQEWLRTTAAPGARDVWAAATAPSDDAAECRVCPVCQLLRVVRSARPEAFEHLADAATSFAAAVRGLLADSATARDTATRHDGVQRIDLG